MKKSSDKNLKPLFLSKVTFWSEIGGGSDFGIDSFPGVCLTSGYPTGYVDFENDYGEASGFGFYKGNIIRYV